MYKILPRGFLIIGLIAVSCVMGCATHTRTVRTDVVTTPADTAYSRSPTVVEHQTTTTETTSSGGCGGVLSCTVDVTGEVIALPFRAVGGVLSAIF
jgi:hypothetical protein